MDSWFEVDREGLAAQLERRGKSFAVLELLQNALDEPGVTAVHIRLRSTGKRGLAHLEVIDNAPGGYANLSHAYTFFAPSTKLSNPEQRGRFNSGEKLVLALCKWASVYTTSGCVHFRADGTRERGRRSTFAGTKFMAEIRFSKLEIEAAIAAVHHCIIPPGIKVLVNDLAVLAREPVITFEATLPTEVDFRPTQRKTTIGLHAPYGQQASICEMGIPVVEYEGDYDINVHQRVPLNTDRDNVTPAYRRKLWAVTLDHVAEDLTPEQAGESWVREAIPHVAPEVAKTALTARFGTKTAIYDPSDREASKRLQDRGYTILYGRSLTPTEHRVVKETGAFRPAGQIMPSGIKSSADGVPPIPRDDWTPGMNAIEAYVQEVGKVLLGFAPGVNFYKMPSKDRWAACWRNRSWSLNVSSWGKEWIENPDRVQLDSIIIHEFAHHFARDHFSDSFIKACCDLGAKLAEANANKEDRLLDAEGALP